MASVPAAPRRTPSFIDPPGCVRHRPDETLLYQLVEERYPAFLDAREAAGQPLPQWVLSLPFALRFLLATDS